MSDADTKIVTYIIKTLNSEYYVGKTINLDRRVVEHRLEKHPGWFSINESRKDFQVIMIFMGDIEKTIKRFGIKSYLEVRSKEIKVSAS